MSWAPACAFVGSDGAPTDGVVNTDWPAQSAPERKSEIDILLIIRRKQFFISSWRLPESTP